MPDIGTLIAWVWLVGGIVAVLALWAWQDGGFGGEL